MNGEEEIMRNWGKKEDGLSSLVGGLRLGRKNSKPEKRRITLGRFGWSVEIQGNFLPWDNVVASAAAALGRL